MKTEPPDPLHAAVLAGDEPDDFRAATLRHVLREARRRRQVRLVRRAGASVIALAGLLAWFSHSSPEPFPEKANSPGPKVAVETTTPQPMPPPDPDALQLIHSTPLAAAQWVHSRDAQFSRVEDTADHGLVKISSADLQGIEIIATSTAAPKLKFLSDRQLLSIVPGQTKALVAFGSADVRLIQGDE